MDVLTLKPLSIALAGLITAFILCAIILLARRRQHIQKNQRICERHGTPMGWRKTSKNPNPLNSLSKREHQYRLGSEEIRCRQADHRNQKEKAESDRSIS